MPSWLGVTPGSPAFSKARCPNRRSWSLSRAQTREKTTRSESPWPRQRARGPGGCRPSTQAVRAAVALGDRIKRFRAMFGAIIEQASAPNHTIRIGRGARPEALAAGASRVTLSQQAHLRPFRRCEQVGPEREFGRAQPISFRSDVETRPDQVGPRTLAAHSAEKVRIIVTSSS